MKLRDFEILKYASYKNAEKIVRGQSLKFSNPESFNDPFDCNIDLLQFNYEEVSTDVLSDICELKKLIPQNIPSELLLEAYKHSQLEKIRRSSICCFSMRYDVSTMWAHYADDHNGVSLVFDYQVEQLFEDIPKTDISQLSRRAIAFFVGFSHQSYHFALYRIKIKYYYLCLWQSI